MAEADNLETNIKDQFLNAAGFLKTVTMKLEPSQLLEFYAYYKQATIGKCTFSRPSWYNMAAKQKWDAWNALGNMAQDEAMEKYVTLLSHLFPNWDKSDSTAGGGQGWVTVSSMANDELELCDSEKKINDWVREGDKTKVEQYAKNNNINNLDSEGLGPIHWAADRGNLDMLKFLISDLKANIELQDQEGQTALHYAASCGHTDIVKYLIENGANITVKDDDGATPLDVAEEEVSKLFVQ